MTLRLRAAWCAALGAMLTLAAHAAPPTRGLTAASSIARAYDVILNADFAALPGALATACGPPPFDHAQDSPDRSTGSGSRPFDKLRAPTLRQAQGPERSRGGGVEGAESRERSRGAPSEACDTLEAVALSWRIALDPEDRSLDAELSAQVGLAIGATRQWTRREPDRAEAWFYHGAAYGARVQWRVLRGERLAAARDGKRIKDALERALALDPEMHDAEFGIGMYRYYAAVAPAALRVLRWLLMLPGGDRAGGLQQMIAARDKGRLVRGEADYQLHIVYLWYERRVDEALQLVDSLRARYPRNPLFHQARAQILDVYFHDRSASLRAWEDLRLRAEARLVNEAPLAAGRATIRSAELLDALDETDRAVALLDPLVTRHPARPHGVVAEATRLLVPLRQRLASQPYRTALEAWRALERGDLDDADRAFRRSLALDASSAVTRYRYALLLIAQRQDDQALDELDRVLASAATLSPVVRANALFERAEIMARRGDRARARALYLEASRVFGADRIVTERAAQLARTIDQR